MTFIPRPTEPLIDSRGLISPVWLDYLRSLSPDLQLAELWAAVRAVNTRVDEISSTTTQQNNLLGQGSIVVYGDLSQSNASAQLAGDENAPAASRYYGTDEDGRRGFHALVLAALADVSATAPSAGQVLAFDGSQWAPATNAATSLFNYISADGEPYATEDGDLYIGV